jgi:hypothetical protein
VRFCGKPDPQTTVIISVPKRFVKMSEFPPPKEESSHGKRCRIFYLYCLTSPLPRLNIYSHIYCYAQFASYGVLIHSYILGVHHVTVPLVTESNFPNLVVSAVNVTSFNLSSFKEGGCKTMEKIVAIMRRNSDIIILTDCRLTGGVEKIRKIFRLGRGTQYNFYANSSRSERGVCIAVKRGRDIEILHEERDLHSENFLLLRCRVEGRELLIGGVYGPNINDVAFYTSLKTKVESYDIPFILGGDFNTVLSGAQGDENLDLEDRQSIPNKYNGKFIREWIEGGECVTLSGKNIQCPVACHMYPSDHAKGLTMYGLTRIMENLGLTSFLSLKLYFVKLTRYSMEKEYREIWTTWKLFLG